MTHSTTGLLIITEKYAIVARVLRITDTCNYWITRYIPQARRSRMTPYPEELVCSSFSSSINNKKNTSLFTNLKITEFKIYIGTEYQISRILNPRYK